jgi:hypothetical protein
LKEVCEERQTLKIELIEENRLLCKSYSAEVKKHGLLEVKSVNDNAKITNLKRTNNQLMLDIRRERQASNFIVDDAMVEARRLSADALEMMAKANDTIITEHEKTAASLHEEPAHHSRESERLQQKQAVSIEKLKHDQALLVQSVQSKCDAKYHKVREDVAYVSKKLKEQRLMWQTRLRDIDLSSKHHRSKERARRRNMIQLQLDNSSAIECQLIEIIAGLEVMNNDLFEEVKSAKKAKREAIRLYDKSKEDATRRLDQLC